jgi:protein SCO1/2
MLPEDHVIRNYQSTAERIANLAKVDIIAGIVIYSTSVIRGPMDSQSTKRLFCRQGLCQAGAISLFFLILIFSSQLIAAVPQHKQTAPEGMAHDNQTTPQDMTEMGQKEHVHPAETDETASKVGLDEKLGDYIPLDLTFRDEKGNQVSLAELITKPTIIAPVYYRCPNVCHYLQGDLARVLPGINLKAGEDYQVISFSFDETEQPELALRSRNTYYAAMKNQYPDQAWRFLTGDLAAIMQLTDAAGYYFKRANAEFLHPVAFFVVSSEGQIIRYLHGTHIVPKDLTLALYEAKSGKVGTTIRKMVQYCFSFDPEQKTYVFNILRVSATAILITLAIFAAFLIFGGKKSRKDKNL